MGITGARYASLSIETQQTCLCNQRSLKHVTRTVSPFTCCLFVVFLPTLDLGFGKDIIPLKSTCWRYYRNHCLAFAWDEGNLNSSLVNVNMPTRIFTSRPLYTLCNQKCLLTLGHEKLLLGWRLISYLQDLFYYRILFMCHVKREIIYGQTGHMHIKNIKCVCCVFEILLLPQYYETIKKIRELYFLFGSSLTSRPRVKYQ